MNGLKLKYFVLNPFSSDKNFAFASKLAVIEFAKAIQATNPELAIDLMNWLEG